MAKRKCAKAGCRAWAMHESVFCGSHRNLSEGDLAPDFGFEDDMAAERDQKFGKYAAPVTVEELATLERLQTSEGLQAEIELARLLVIRALDEGDPTEIGKAILVLKTLVLEERRLNGGQAIGLIENVSVALLDLFGQKEVLL
jgi:hypothetical protein